MGLEGSARTRDDVGGRRPRFLCRRLVAGALVFASSASVRTADAFVVIVNSSVPGTTAHRADVAAVFLRKAGRWGDGSPPIPVDQSGTSAVRRDFSDAVLPMPVTAVLQYWQRQLVSSSLQVKVPLVKGSDDEVLAYVAKTRGSVGYVASGAALPPGVRVVTITE